jgi:hypothetical protein
MYSAIVLISYGLGFYLVIGFVFGLYFVTCGIRDEPIEGKALILRLMLLPAAILIWPILAWRRP